jgi:hypothetical protein
MTIMVELVQAMRDREKETITIQHTKNPNQKMNKKKKIVSFISSLSLIAGSGQTPDLPYYGCEILQI